ncbi:MAG: hypothetical protein JNL85_11925 [Rubrivivax sp.]|nr:hypothetical protein [Rubrivivax sp.]
MPSPSTLDEGRALYEGRHPALAATLRGESRTPLPAQQAACLSCHRPSGLGSFEGEAVVPPISSGLLSRPFDPATTRRYGPRGQPGEPGVPRVRPAYDAAALHRLLTEGVAPDGRALGPLMPRYTLAPRHSEALLAFLDTLGTQPAPGVDDDVVHFATITGDDVPEAQARQLVLLLEQFIARKNAQTRGEVQRRAAARRTEHVMYARYRRWELHHWALRGAPDTWPRQLAALYAARPVFAVLSGRSDRDWSPVHRFCEAERVPCLFPITAWPHETGGFYTAYFSGGVLAQARWLAQAGEAAPAAPAPGRPWLVLGGDAQHEQAQAQRIASALGGEGGAAAAITASGHWHGEPVIVSALPAREVAQRLAAGMASARAAAPRVYLLAGASPPASEPVAWPPGVDVQWVTQQAADATRLARARAWWRAQGLRPADEALAAQVLFAATAAVESLVHVDERFSREYCLEKLEHNLENMPPLTAYPRLALGPNQRLAAKSVWLARVP